MHVFRLPYLFHTFTLSGCVRGLVDRERFFYLYFSLLSFSMFELSDHCQILWTHSLCLSCLTTVRYCGLIFYVLSCLLLTHFLFELSDHCQILWTHFLCLGCLTVVSSYLFLSDLSWDLLWPIPTGRIGYWCCLVSSISIVVLRIQWLLDNRSK